MNEFELFIKKMKNLPVFIEKSLQEIFENNTGTISDLQTDQMYSGLNSYGAKIKPPYTDLTVNIKKSKGQISDHVTLKDTGDFYSGIDTEISDVKKQNKTFTVDYEILSSDLKTDKLGKKYGYEIFGLSKKYEKKLINEQIFPELKDNIENYLTT